MAQASGKTEQVNPVPQHGDHDRVVMLSLKADGTPDQHNPEVIGDPEFAAAAARRQFTEQAVSAADVEARGVSAGDGGVVEDAPQDPTVDELAKKHEQAAKSAESAADKTVKQLHKG